MRENIRTAFQKIIQSVSPSKLTGDKFILLNNFYPDIKNKNIFLIIAFDKRLKHKHGQFTSVTKDNDLYLIATLNSSLKESKAVTDLTRKKVTLVHEMCHVVAFILYYEYKQRGALKGKLLDSALNELTIKENGIGLDLTELIKSLSATEIIEYDHLYNPSSKHFSDGVFCKKFDFVDLYRKLLLSSETLSDIFDDYKSRFIEIIRSKQSAKNRQLQSLALLKEYFNRVSRKKNLSYDFAVERFIEESSQLLTLNNLT